MVLQHRLAVLAVSILGGWLCALSASDAAAKNPSFVADAVQAAPGKPSRSGKLYVGPEGTRFEFTDNGKAVVQIIQPAKGLFRLLFPETRTYIEMRGQASSLPAGERPNNPCPPPGAPVDCSKQGMVSHSGQQAEQWQIKPKQGNGGVMTVLWDPERRMPLSQQFPDGSRMQAQKTGEIEFEGRKVEQWSLSHAAKSGQQQNSYMLYAPDLGMPVMEQGATGAKRELHNIKLMPIGSDMYEVPAGYTKVTPKPAPGQRQ